MTAQDSKREAVFEAAADVFSTYGFRRTAMSDIAKAAGMSRPALYLMFTNKESLFRELAAFRQNQAIDEAIIRLARDEPLPARFIGAILTYEKVFYEPVAQSPHGAELIDINQSIAADSMKVGRDRLLGRLAAALEEAEVRGEATFAHILLTPRAYVELFMASINGVKKAATSNKDFRRRLRQMGVIFMASIAASFDRPEGAPRREAGRADEREDE